MVLGLTVIEVKEGLEVQLVSGTIRHMTNIAPKKRR
jgi:hypothetical protein